MNFDQPTAERDDTIQGSPQHPNTHLKPLRFRLIPQKNRCCSYSIILRLWRNWACIESDIQDKSADRKMIFSASYYTSREFGLYSSAITFDKQIDKLNRLSGLW